MTPKRLDRIKNLNPALLGDLAIGLVDGGDLLGGDGDEFLRHAAGHQLVGMIVGHELAVMALQAVIADRGIDAQDLVGVALGRGNVARLDIGELRIADAEALGDLVQELLLARMQHVVSLGDVEQPFENVLEKLAIALEHDRELFGVGLVAGHILLGEIEDASNVLHLAFRHLEHFLKALTSSMVTTPSALAILAPSAITPTVKATWFSAGPSCS